MKQIKFRNLLKYQKVSKYYDHDCLQIFLPVFMPLLTASVVFQKNVLIETSKPFNTKFRSWLKNRKSSYEVRQNLALFCNLVAQKLYYLVVLKLY